MSSQKCAVVMPVLKKPTLDASDTGNYKPISNLTFLSKLLERCAYDQLRVYLQVNNLLPEHQSAYRRFHSTEMAMLEVVADTYVAADTGHVTLLSLLDLSASFDTVAHSILVERTRRSNGIVGRALDWLKSYLTG